MDANVETNVATAVITTAEVSEANGLKRKFTISRATSEVVEDSPANKRRKSSRNSTSGTVSETCWAAYWSSKIKVKFRENITWYAIDRFAFTSF